MVAVIAALISTLRSALRVSVVGVLLAVQLTASLTKMSPLPVPAPVVVMVMLLVTSWADSVAPEMLLPGALPMTKSCGSISQVPVRPAAEAVVTRASALMLTCAAEVSIKPPSPPSGALASSVPRTSMVPVCMSPSSRIVPLRFSIVRAWIVPVLLTTVFNRSPAACAVSSTCPPSARIIPPFSASALTAPLDTATFNRPSPVTSMVTASPAASATLPSRAAMTPWLLTLRPISATCPPSAAVIVPRLTTDPAPASVNAYRLARKFSSERFIVEATSPPTFTEDPAPNRIPLGLSRNTLPLELRLPRITDGSAPITRFSATDELPGCTNRTDSPPPMLKPCQLITTLDVDWVIVVAGPLVVIVATPERTTPSSGPACAVLAMHRSSDTHSVLRAKRGALAVLRDGVVWVWRRAFMR